MTRAGVDVDELATRIFDRALLRGSFVLRSGATSDRYLDKYRITTDPTLLADVAEALEEQRLLAAPTARVIVAPALGAVPLATALSLRSGLPFVIVREQGKEYGTANRIEGTVEPGAAAVLVEDVVTSGGAALEALEAARDAGLVIAATLCVLDRDGGGAEALTRAGAPLTSLLSATDMDAAAEAGAGTVVTTP